MAFQNLLLGLGAAAVEKFGEGFLARLFRVLWEEQEVVDEGRAEEILTGALGRGTGVAALAAGVLGEGGRDARLVRYSVAAGDGIGPEVVGPRGR
ncbi:hypothetical protein GBA65_03125 [Rubrobacter marinus]|uniref:Uncharacterized protein n=1 Tax=Rubrobacter marinus TaxID=2653852 RepID=A0A6G8PUT9_9ACTN|nr:hypothetical protein [Rubrobacter marinus]QIN77665.1 hypothetical protein GBA65_03125 [Rubrobacter marinus]